MRLFQWQKGMCASTEVILVILYRRNSRTLKKQQEKHNMTGKHSTEHIKTKHIKRNACPAYKPYPSYNYTRDKRGGGINNIPAGAPNNFATKHSLHISTYSISMTLSFCVFKIVMQEIQFT
jgi:hypothetical protein